MKTLLAEGTERVFRTGDDDLFARRNGMRCIVLMVINEQDEVYLVRFADGVDMSATAAELTVR